MSFVPLLAFSLMFVGALGFILWAATQLPSVDKPPYSNLDSEDLLHILSQINGIAEAPLKDYMTPLDALYEIRLLTERSLHGVKPAPLLILTND